MPVIAYAIIVKLFLTLFIWYITTEINAKQKFIFYKNLGISTFKFFSVLYLIDIFITITFLIVVKEFI